MLILLYIVLSAYDDSFFALLPLFVYPDIAGGALFLLSQLNRLVAKEIFQRIMFQDELKMPTITRLLWSDGTLPNAVKSIIRKKIKIDFCIELMNPENEKK